MVWPAILLLDSKFQFPNLENNDVHHNQGSTLWVVNCPISGAVCPQLAPKFPCHWNWHDEEEEKYGEVNSSDDMQCLIWETTPLCIPKTPLDSHHLNSPSKSPTKPSHIPIDFPPTKVIWSWVALFKFRNNFFYGRVCLDFVHVVQGDFFHWCAPKNLKYGKPRLGESTLT